jgi:modulator of FtsH protease HflK
VPDNVIFLNKTPDDWRELIQKSMRSGGLIAAVVVLLTVILLGNPFYTVGPTEQAVVLRFGEHVRTTPPGLRLKLPWPVERVIIVDVQKVQQLAIGFQMEDKVGRYRDARRMAKTSGGGGELMLTGDENIILVKLGVQYRAKDPVAFLFNVDDPKEALRDICEASLRKVVGDYGVDMALTEGKAAIEEEIRQSSQDLADRYGLGIDLTNVNLRDAQPPDQVQDAFKSVISAKEKKQQIINEAQTYRNGQIPRAEGEAAAIVNEASAYAQERVLRAQGEVERFSALLQEYRIAKEVTKDRLYLETIEEVLELVDVTVVDRNIGNLLPLLDLSSGTPGILPGSIRSGPPGRPAGIQGKGGIR